MGKLEQAFWNVLKTVGLIVAVPAGIAKIINHYLGYNEVRVIVIGAILIWIISREFKIWDLKKKDRRKR